MSEFVDKDFELYKLSIDDEHYYRKMFHSRLSYHTNILVALLTAIGAGYLQSTSVMHYFLLALFSLLFSWITSESKGALERIYDHFIEMLKFREELEVRLGLRELQTLGTPALPTTNALSDKPTFWTDGRFFKKPWTNSRSQTGYFARMKRIFDVFCAIGIISAFVSFVIGLASLFMVG